MDDKISGLLGLSNCSKNGEEFDYYIAGTSKNDIPLGMSEYIVPATTWAIFECIGAMPQAFQDLQKRIVTMATIFRI
jgi:AraC family transcriptional regulator